MSIFKIAALGLALLSSPALAIQTLNCHFSDPQNSDRLMVILNTDQTGSLSYLTGTSEDTASTSADGAIALSKVDVGTKDMVGFATNVTAMQMIFKMPSAQLLKATGTFKATLSTQIQDLSTSPDQDLACDSVVSKSLK